MTPFGPVLSAAGIMALVWLCDVVAMAARSPEDVKSLAAWRNAALACTLLIAAWFVRGAAPQPRLMFMLQLLTLASGALALAQWRVRAAHARHGASKIKERSG